MATTDDATLALRDWGARLGPGFFSVSEHTPHRMWTVRAGDGQSYMLKRAREVVPADALDLLRSRGVPVAPPLPADDGERSKPDGDYYWTLYDHLPGAPITDHLAPGAHERAIEYGDAIGRLHLALASIGAESRPMLDLAGIVRDAARVPPVAATPDQIRVWQDSKESLPPILEGLPAHLLHRDPNPLNMLFENGKMSGWVDFDLAVKGPRIFDPCYCASAILSHCPASIEVRAAWTPIAIELLSAYDRVVGLTAHERGALGPTLMAIQILFVGFSHAQGRDDFAVRDLATLDWLHHQWAPAIRASALASP